MSGREYKGHGNDTAVDSLSLSLPRHRTPSCKSENSPSHTAHTHKRVKHPERSRLDGQVGGWFDAPGHQTVPQHDRGFIIHFFPPTSSSSSHLPVGRETVWYFRISLLPNEAKEAPGYILYQLRITRTVSMALLHVRVFIKKKQKNKDTRWCKVRFILARLGCVLSAYIDTGAACAAAGSFVRPSVCFHGAPFFELLPALMS